MFSTEHFIWLGICAAFIAGLMLIAKLLKLDFKKALAVALAISFASEAFKIFTHIDDVVNEDGEIIGGVLGANYLPLHLCSIVIFLLIYLYLTQNDAKREAVKSFVTPVTILGGTMALLIPTSGVDFLQPYAYQCFIYHAGIMWFSIYLIATKQVNLGFKAYKRNLAVMGGLIVVMLWVNSALHVYDTNFFFIVKPPMENLPILNLDNGWIAYFFTIVAIGLTLVTLFHLPFMIMERKADKEKRIEEVTH